MRLENLVVFQFSSVDVRLFFRLFTTDTGMVLVSLVLEFALFGAADHEERSQKAYVRFSMSTTTNSLNVNFPIHFVLLRMMMTQPRALAMSNKKIGVKNCYLQIRNWI